MSNLDRLREWLLAKAEEHEDLAPPAQVPFLAVVELHLRWPRLLGFDGTTGVIQRIGDLDEFKPGPTADLHARMLSRNYPEAAVVNALSQLYNALVADGHESRPSAKPARNPDGTWATRPKQPTKA